MEHKIQVLNAEDIEIGDRVRQKPGDLKGLAKSMEQNGQLQPIIVSDNRLVAGWRRTMACLMLLSEDSTIKDLEPGHILAMDKEDLDEYQKLIIEYIENVERKAFEKAEEALAIAKLKAGLESIRGETVTSRELAKEIGVSHGQIGMALKVADAVENEGRRELLEENSIAGAYRKMRSTKKLEQLVARTEKAEAAGNIDTSFTERLLHGDGIEFMKALDSESVDLVHLDPPWGINVDSYDRNQNYGTFDDSPDLGSQLAQAFIPEAYRVLKEDTYMLLWFGIQFYQPLLELMETAGFKVNYVPYIWYKTNKAGAQNDPSKTTINVWEPLFIASKGDPRMFKQAGKNLLEFPMPKAGRTHFAQKSVDMLKELLERFTYEKMNVVDPTFGSGSFLVAAEMLNRTYFGAERDEDYFNSAVQWIKNVKAAK